MILHFSSLPSRRRSWLLLCLRSDASTPPEPSICVTNFHFPLCFFFFVQALHQYTTVNLPQFDLVWKEGSVQAAFGCQVCRIEAIWKLCPQSLTVRETNFKPRKTHFCNPNLKFQWPSSPDRGSFYFLSPRIPTRTQKFSLFCLSRRLRSRLIKSPLSGHATCFSFVLFFSLFASFESFTLLCSFV